MTLKNVSVVTKPPVSGLAFLSRGEQPKDGTESPSLSIQEGGKAMLICNYTNYSPAFIQWYRQDPGRGLLFLLLIRENEHEKQTGRLSTTFDTRVKQTAFHIAASQPADSATYFCAADTQ